MKVSRKASQSRKAFAEVTSEYDAEHRMVYFDLTTAEGSVFRANAIK